MGPKGRQKGRMAYWITRSATAASESPSASQGGPLLTLRACKWEGRADEKGYEPTGGVSAQGPLGHKELAAQGFVGSIRTHRRVGSGPPGSQGAGRLGVCRIGTDPQACRLRTSCHRELAA